MKSKTYLSEIWVCCEKRGAELTAGSKELLGKAKGLSKAAGCITAAVLFAETAGDAAAYGADKVYLFPPSREEVWADALQEQIKHMKKGRPWAFLFTADTRGRIVSASLSVKLKTGLTADCVELSVEDGYLKQTRPAFGNSLMADILCKNTYPQMATVQRGTFPMPKEDKTRQAEIVLCELAEKQPFRVLEQNEAEGSSVSLQDAKIVLAGGMGLATKENFALLERAAKAIGAVPAASRAAVNAGLAPYAWQVGQSGKTVRPEIYIACGISGAVQHLAGIQGAGCIVAVNMDKKAPIFDHADIGMLEDCSTFLKRLEKMKEI